ncbi:MAG: 3'-5' exonuclease [Bacteroides sp.]|nr:3'-5' exonuclease [Bacteroides sp.]MCM1448619.1 3'-5' exonuclease [Bacteroides sp.]
MKLNLTKPIIFFDLETTGIDVATDRIVELSIVRIETNGNRQSMTMRLNPEKHIPAEASAVHGIFDADVKDCPTFKDKAEELKKIFDGCDLAGFNSNRFDIPVLAEEFIRAGVIIDLNSPRRVDVQNIYHKLERRTLTAAYKFYCNKDLENAHSALADTEATLEVLEAQLDHYPEELKNDIEFLADYSSRDNFVDFAGRFAYNEKGEEIVNFGKHKGRLVKDVLRVEPSYYNWMMQSDFTMNTKQVLTRLKYKYSMK